MSRRKKNYEITERVQMLPFDCGHTEVLQRVMGERSFREFAAEIMPQPSHSTVYSWYRQGYVPELWRQPICAISADKKVKPADFAPPWVA